MSAKSTAVDEFSDSIGVALEPVVVLDLLSCIVVREREIDGRNGEGENRGLQWREAGEISVPS